MEKADQPIEAVSRLTTWMCRAVYSRSLAHGTDGFVDRYRAHRSATGGADVLSQTTTVHTALGKDEIKDRHIRLNAYFEMQNQNQFSNTVQSAWLFSWR